ncbi:porin [Vibrio agarivorans]|uniref:Porin n=1 Tax=Vibrio agarivorans TaxID=153622 RepID=A0ABT7XX02_9VIBR|nr:porin [Vibrio agarivorans]MDN2480311.1 porin [Vibrio agarivorans]
MKKTIIALAVSATAVATGANAGEIYNQDGTSLSIGGRAEARLSIKDGKADDKSRIRLNFLGKQEITDSLYGVGFYEGEFTTEDRNDNSDIEHRYTYAGIGGNFGEVTYGKNDGALGVITDFTDIMAYHGNSAAYKIEVADRIDNTLAYSGSFYDFDLKASYRFADRIDDQNSDKFTDDKQDGYSLSGIYNVADTGLALAAAYADQGDKNNNVERSQYMLAASYTFGDFYVAGTYVDGTDKSTLSGEGFNKADNTGYELAAAYTMGKTVFTTSYNYLESKVDGTKGDVADNFAIDATYYFKPNFRTYISYNFNLIDSGDRISDGTGTSTATKRDAEDELALGIRYDF